MATAAALHVSAARVRGPRFRRVLRGVYVEASTPPTLLLDLDAAMLLTPHGWASHLSAAALLGVPVPAGSPMHLGIFRGQPRCRVPGVRIHEHRLAPELTWIQERPCVLPATVLNQLASRAVGWDLPDLVAAGDVLVRHEHCSPVDLLAACVPGSLATAAAALVRPGVDSPPETRLRLLLVLAGLPEPESNRRVLNAHGGWLAQPDLSYPEQRIAIEYEGEHHRTDRRQWQRDIARQENVEAEGWIVLRVTARDLYQQPGPTACRVLEALHRRQHPDAPAHVSWAFAEILR